MVAPSYIQYVGLWATTDRLSILKIHTLDYVHHIFVCIYYAVIVRKYVHTYICVQNKNFQTDYTSSIIYDSVNFYKLLSC